MSLSKRTKSHSEFQASLIPPVSFLPSPAALSIEAGWAWFSAELASVAWVTGACPIKLVASAHVALAVAVTARAKSPPTTLAAPSKLLTRRVAASTLVVAAAAPPARLTDTSPRLLVTLRVEAAIASTGTLGAPPAGLAGALAHLLVALPMLAQASILALWTPAVGVACALPCHVFTLPIRVAPAHLLAVGAPELAGTLCRQLARDN